MADKTYIIQVGAQNAEQTAKQLTAVADAEKKIADVRAPKDGTPFDAVAEAAPRAAEAARKSAQAVTTSYQQIQKEEASAAQLRAANEDLELRRATKMFQKRLGVTEEQARALAKARISENRDNLAERALGPLGTMGFGDLGDALGFGGKAIGLTGRLALGATVALSFQRAIAATRNEARNLAIAQGEVTRSFEQGNFGAGAPQIIANIGAMSEQVRKTRMQVNDAIYVHGGDDVMSATGKRLRVVTDWLGITADMQEEASAGAEVQRQKMDAAAEKAVKLGEMTARAAEMAAGGHKREAEALQRKAALELELEKIATTPGIGYGRRAELLRQRQRVADAEEEIIKQQQEAEDARQAMAAEAGGRGMAAEAGGRGIAVEAQAAGLMAAGREREAGELQRMAALREKILGIAQQQVPVEARMLQILTAQATAGAVQAKIHQDAADAQRETLRVMDQQAEIAELLAAQRGFEAQQLQRQAALDAQIFQIERDGSLTQEEREERIAAARASHRRQHEAWNTEQQRAERQALDASRDGVEIVREQARGHADVVAMLTIQKELTDRINAIRANPNLNPEAKGRLERDAQEEARTRALAGARDKFNEAFDQKIARKNQTPQEQAQQRAGEQMWRSQQRAEIQNLMNAEEARINKQGRLMTEEQKRAFRDDLIDARSKAVPDYRRKLGEDEAGRRTSVPRVDPQQKVEGIRDRTRAGQAPEPQHMQPLGPMEPLGHMAGNAGAVAASAASAPPSISGSIDTAPVADALRAGAQQAGQQIAAALEAISPVELGPIVSAVAALQSKVAAQQAQIDSVSAATYN